MTESDTSILFDQYHSHLYLLFHLSAFLDQKRSQEVQAIQWIGYSLYFGLKLLKRRKETLGKRVSGSCSERMVRAPFERGKTGGQRLNHEDCKVAGLQRSRPYGVKGSDRNNRSKKEWPLIPFTRQLFFQFSDPTKDSIGWPNSMSGLASRSSPFNTYAITS